MDKFVDLYEHIEDKCYIKRTERFQSWYEMLLDLPGHYYLESVQLLFKQNCFAKGEFIALGEKLSLKTFTSPLFLLTGDANDITPREQVLAAEKPVGTPKSRIAKKRVSSGHIGIFMRRRTLKQAWPEFGKWIPGNAVRC